MTKYIVTGTDPMMPLGRQEAEGIARGLEVFLAQRDVSVCSIPHPVDIYRVVDGGMCKVGGKGAMPFMLDADTFLMPISETVAEYSYTGFELWKRKNGEWERAECNEAKRHNDALPDAKPESWRDRPSLD